MSFADVAGEYLSKRWDQATQPFTDPEGYFNNRLQEQFGVDMNGNTKPISTTIKYGDDGSQQVTTKHHVNPAVPTSNEDLQGAMSMDAGPAVPQMPQPGPPVQVASNNQQLPATQAAPQAPVMPNESADEMQRLRQQAAIAQGTPVGAVNPAQVTNPQAQAQVEVTPTGTVQTTAAPLPVQQVVQQAAPVQQQPGAPVQAVAPNAPPSQAQIAEQMAQAQAQAQDIEGGYSQQAKIKGTPEFYHEQLIGVANEKDPVTKRQQYANLLADPTLSDENKKIVYKQIHDEHSQAERMKAALKEVDAMTPNDAARALKQKGEEGSFVKYFLAHRLGLTEMARDQAAKLGYGNTISSEMDADGNRYRVERDLNGAIRGAQDMNGNDAGQDAVARLSAGALSGKITTSGTFFQTKDGEILRAQSAEGGGSRLVYADSGKVYKGGTKGLVKLEEAGALRKMDYGLVTDLKKKHGNNVLDAEKDYVALNGPLNDVQRQQFRELYGYNQALPGKGEAPAAGGTAGAPVKEEPTIDGQPTSVKAPANNNPGNIIDSNFARANGATNTGPIGSQGRFANFSNVDAGENAQHVLLSNPTYSKLPLRDISRVWAPKGDGANDPAAYAKTWQKLTGFDDATMGKTYLDLTPDQQNTFRDAQRRIEHGAPVSGGTTTAGGLNKPLEKQKQESTIAGKVTGEEQTMFLKTKQEVSKNADTGREVADITRGQVKDLMTSPEMIGYLTGDSTQSAQVGKLIREVATGSFAGGEGQGKELADRMSELSLPTTVRSKLEAFRQANTKINALTLRSNEGPGAISNFENKQNQANNMTNVGDLTPWSALNGLGKRQFVGDLSLAKQQFMARNEGVYKTDTQFQNAWSKERDSAMKSYEGVYAARLKAIQPYYDAANKAPNDRAAQQQYRDAAVASFRTFPTPDWNPSTGKWDYKTKESRLAVMNAIAGGQ